MTIVRKQNITPDDIKTELLPNRIAELLNAELARISEEFLWFTSEFQHQKCGVKTKMIFENTTVPRDKTLFRNIALAEMIGNGVLYPFI